MLMNMIMIADCQHLIGALKSDPTCSTLSIEFPVLVL